MVVRVYDLPEALVARISLLDDFRSSRSTFPADLKLHGRVGSQIEQPRWRAICAAVGSDQQVVIAIARVDQRVCAHCTGTASRGAEKERGTPIMRWPMRPSVRLYISS